MVGQDLMRFGVTTPVTSALILLGGMVVCAAGVLGVFIALRNGLRADLLLSGVVLPIVFGGFLLWRWQVRGREMGPVVVDRATRSITHEPSGRHWSFDDVTDVRLVRDLTDGTRLDLFPEIPKWLVVEFQDGARVRLGKGGRDDLAPTQNWLEQAGLRSRH